MWIFPVEEGYKIAENQNVVLNETRLIEILDWNPDNIPRNIILYSEFWKIQKF